MENLHESQSSTRTGLSVKPRFEGLGVPTWYSPHIRSKNTPALQPFSEMKTFSCRGLWFGLWSGYLRDQALVLEANKSTESAHSLTAASEASDRRNNKAIRSWGVQGQNVMKPLLINELLSSLSRLFITLHLLPFFPRPPLTPRFYFGSISFEILVITPTATVEKLLLARTC